jgi:hypothetical protein
MKMKMERKYEKVVELPAKAACRVCKYQISDICPDCLSDNLSKFDPKNMAFYLLPLFTMDEYKELPNRIKGKLLAFYVIKIMEVLNGRDIDDPPSR